MPVATRGEQLRPLYIEQMKLGIDVNPQRSPLCVCHVPGCMIRYNSSDGGPLYPAREPE